VGASFFNDRATLEFAAQKNDTFYMY